MNPTYFITYIFIGIVVIVSLKGFSDRLFVDKYLFVPYNVKHNKEYYRFFTHGFLHADPMHLIFNLFVFYNFGELLEKIFVFTRGVQLGSIEFVVFVLSALIVSSMISYARHSDNPGYRSLGFSGVTSAVLFAFIILSPKASLSLMFLPIPVPAWLFGLLYLAFEIYSDRNRKTNIAHDAHIAGAVFGVVFILFTNIEQVKISFNSLFP